MKALKAPSSETLAKGLHVTEPAGLPRARPCRPPPSCKGAHLDDPRGAPSSTLDTGVIGWVEARETKSKVVGGHVPARSLAACRMDPDQLLLQDGLDGGHPGVNLAVVVPIAVMLAVTVWFRFFYIRPVPAE